MSYAVAAALQAAVYQRLAGDDALAALTGGAIYDALPPGILPGLYVALGPEAARDRSDGSGHGAEHDFTVSVVTDSAGFAPAKAAAAAISDALVDAPLQLARGRLLRLDFLQARAARNGEERQIDMTFRARVEDV
ncbi:MAG: DUF3168 domain-containing protein [Rubellimicrobium sp.]|nr:DUF3168 domain-containing protein [Rubellimicrobium sp.]